MQPFRHQCVNDAQHQRGVATGMMLSHSAPASSGRSARSGLTSTNSQPRSRARAHRAALDMLADAAARNHRVLQRHAAEGEHNLAVLRRSAPR